MEGERAAGCENRLFVVADGNLQSVGRSVGCVTLALNARWCTCFVCASTKKANHLHCCCCSLSYYWAQAKKQPELKPKNNWPAGITNWMGVCNQWRIVAEYKSDHNDTIGIQCFVHGTKLCVCLLFVSLLLFRKMRPFSRSRTASEHKGTRRRVQGCSFAIPYN